MTSLNSAGVLATRAHSWSDGVTTKGPNFDIVVGYNLKSPYHQSLLERYT